MLKALSFVSFNCLLNTLYMIPEILKVEFLVLEKKKPQAPGFFVKIILNQTFALDLFKKE